MTAIACVNTASGPWPSLSKENFRENCAAVSTPLLCLTPQMDEIRAEPIMKGSPARDDVNQGMFLAEDDVVGDSYLSLVYRLLS